MIATTTTIRVASNSNSNSNSTGNGNHKVAIALLVGLLEPFRHDTGQGAESRRHMTRKEY